jgi:hypothetical protein
MDRTESSRQAKTLTRRREKRRSIPKRNILIRSGTRLKEILYKDKSAGGKGLLKATQAET